MKVSLKLMAIMVLFELCGTARLQAGYEWWHHLYDMSQPVYACIESCSHQDGPGQFTWTQQSAQYGVYLAPAVGAAQNLDNGKCYAQHFMTLTLSATRNKSLSVSASDSDSRGVQYMIGGGWTAGETAKGAVSGSIGFSHSWDWTINQTYTEGWTATGATSVSWPESGARKVTGPGAKVSLTGMIIGNKATYALNSKRVHRCYTIIKSSGFIPGMCNNMVAGSTYYTTYSGDGDTLYTGSCTGECPTQVVGAILLEEGQIQNGCSGD